MSKDEKDKYEKISIDHEKMVENFKRINLENELEARRKRLEVVSFVRSQMFDEIPKRDIFVIHSQIFVKIEALEPQYVPAELSVARFSLTDGIKQVKQWFLRPGNVPLGSKRACLENSRKSHKIPLDLLLVEDDTAVSEHAKYTEDGDILDELMTILGGENNLFTLPEFETQTTGVVQTLEKRTGRKLSSLNILSLPLLMFEIANKAPDSEAAQAEQNLHEKFLPFESVAERELEKEMFLFQPGMNCAWHEETTETCHCCSAHVRSWTFTMLDVCCRRYHIPLMPGTHSPLSCL